MQAMERTPPRTPDQTQLDAGDVKRENASNASDEEWSVRRKLKQARGSLATAPVRHGRTKRSDETQKDGGRAPNFPVTLAWVRSNTRATSRATSHHARTRPGVVQPARCTHWGGLHPLSLTFNRMRRWCGPKSAAHCSGWDTVRGRQVEWAAARCGLHTAQQARAHLTLREVPRAVLGSSGLTGRARTALHCTALLAPSTFHTTPLH